MLPSDDYLERCPGVPERKVWFPDEYEAGYRARFAGTSESWTATPCWQAGWQEADRELTVSGRRPRSSSVEPSRDAEPADWSHFGTGGTARSYDLPFHQARSDSWKRSWIQRDIELGTFGRKGSDR